MSDAPDRFSSASPSIRLSSSGEGLHWQAPGFLTEARVLQLSPYGEFKLIGTYYDVHDGQSGEDFTHRVYFREPRVPSFEIPGDDIFAGFVHSGPTCLAVIVAPAAGAIYQPAETEIVVRLEPIDPENGEMSIPGDASFFGGVELAGQLYAVFTSKY